MNSTGITRKLDELGRIVLPMEIRTKFDINPKDALEIFVEDDKIILGKYAPTCIFCGSAQDAVYFHGKLICRKCAELVKNEF